MVLDDLDLNCDKLIKLKFVENMTILKPETSEKTIITKRALSISSLMDILRQYLTFEGQMSDN